MPTSVTSLARPTIRHRRPIRAITCVLVLLTAGACGSAGSTSPPIPTAPAITATSTPASTSTTGSCSNASTIQQWPLGRRAAQLIAVPALDGHVSALSSVISAGVGGILLLGSGTPAGLAGQVAAADRLTPVPPLVMADEEGGGVQRLAGRVASLPWARQMAASMTPAQVQSAAAGVARQMAALGVGMDLAPVLDVDGGPGPDTHHPDGQRSFSAQPSVAARYGVAFADGLRQGGVIPVVKHFPGLGGATANTDDGPASTLPLSTLRAQGLLPFEAAFGAGAPAVMVANATVPGLTTGPASLSSATIQGLLETELGFHGLVLTDSLSAGAITAAGFDLAGATVAAIRAGADMVLFGSTLTPAETALLSPSNVAASVTAAVNAVVAAVQAGRLTATHVDDAVLEVLHVKGVSLCTG